jgi:hypothetical protein
MPEPAHEPYSEPGREPPFKPGRSLAGSWEEPPPKNDGQAEAGT